jgi:diketogulonate reductase-like aldo/keto reductase
MQLMTSSPNNQVELADHAGLAGLAAHEVRTTAELALAGTLARPGVVTIPKRSDSLRWRQTLGSALRSPSDDKSVALDRLFPPRRRKQALGVG